MAGRSTGFRAWRKSRPFWAAVFTILGGLEILVLPLTPLASLVLLGVAGVSSLLTGVLMVVMGLFMIASPPNRMLAGVLTLIFALASFVISNLGGLIIGMVLGIIGGALCIAWTPTGGGKGGRKRRSREPAAEHAAEPGAAPAVQPAPRPSPTPRTPPAPFARRLGRTAVVLGFAAATALGPGGAPAFAAPAAPCLLGVLCLPGGDKPTPSPAAPSRPPPTSSAAATPTPSPTPAPTTTAPAPLVPGLPVPNPLPGLLPTLPLPDVTGGLLPSVAKLLPSGLVTPLLPQVPSDGLVVSGLQGKLTMDTLSVTNFRFLGVVQHRTPTGSVKALRIVVDSSDIGNLGVVKPGPQASTIVTQAPGAPHASTGRLVLDIERISLRAFGVLPLEFSFALPPPPLITLPFLSATAVDIDFYAVQADLRGPSINVTTGPPYAGSGRSSTPPAADSLLSLVSLASLVKVPSLLVPYGFTPAQAATAVQNRDAGRDLTTPAPAAGGQLLGGLLPQAPPPSPSSSAAQPPSSGPPPATEEKPPPKLLGLLPIG